MKNIPCDWHSKIQNNCHLIGSFEYFNKDIYKSTKQASKQVFDMHCTNLSKCVSNSYHKPGRPEDLVSIGSGESLRSVVNCN